MLARYDAEPVLPQRPAQVACPPANPPMLSAARRRRCVRCTTARRRSCRRCWRHCRRHTRRHVQRRPPHTASWWVGGWVERGPAWPGWVAHLTEGIALSSNYSTMIAPPRAWCLASCTQNPQDLGCCFLSTSQLLPLLRCIQQPPCIPTPLHQEEELRNHATEGLNVTKLGLEGRIRELEGAVEAQHQVGGLAWAGGLGGGTAGNDLPISGRVVWCPAAFQPPS